MDDSATPEEIARKIAEDDECAVDDIKVGQIRPMSNGFGMAWTQCPQQATCRVAGKEKVRLGWTIVKVELLKARQIQCFKC